MSFRVEQQVRKNIKSGRLGTEQKEGKLKQWDKPKPDSSNSCVRLGYHGYKCSPRYTTTLQRHSRGHDTNTFNKQVLSI